ERTAGAVSLLAPGCWAQPASAQDPTCMRGRGDVPCRSSRAAADIDGWLQGEIARRDREPTRW
ncbi:MAG TPA: hypothetical protein VFG47_10455, partial [Geminicoccaceae bacterium]|nr:hypothetical protein [Geminicoccaceae bacterium]